MTDDELMQIVQNHTGTPWFNGRAYAEYVGWPQVVGNIANKLDVKIAAARAAKDYATADTLREIRAEIPKHWILETENTA